MEQAVSEHIGEMLLLCLEVDDEPSVHSMRAYLEQNSIGLLTSPSPPSDPPSQEWLGNHSAESVIRQTGLWNLNHVASRYDPSFLDRLSELVEATVQAHKAVTDSPDHCHPTVLEVSVGGFTGSSYAVKWKSDRLIYDRFDCGYSLAESQELHATAADWHAFWKKMDRAGVWTWKERYEDLETCDGTNWSVQIQTADRALASQGINAFPTGFRAFCAAVRKLIGGQEFE